MLALLGLISALAFVYLTQAGRVVQQIAEMDDLETQLRLLRQENNARLLRIAQHERTPLLQERARAMGFGPPEEVQYIEVMLEEPTPSAESQGARGISALWSAEVARFPSWWDSIADQFLGWIADGTESASLPRR